MSRASRPNPGEEKRSPISTPERFADQFGVSRETIEKLEAYAALLRSWQKTINLVAPSTLEDVWHRHFADSAQLVPLAFNHLPTRDDAHPPPSSGRFGEGRTPDIHNGPNPITPLHWLDLGSGAGFPGLVVAILLAGSPKRSTRVTLIESDQRKAAFLREVARRTGTSVDILSRRIEQAATQSNVSRADVVSARALAPLPKLLGLAAPFLGTDALGLFLKGRDVEAEITEAYRMWAFDCTLVPSLTDEDARIAMIRHLGARREVEP